ncbi:MAG: ABC transporter permease [Verrucomicrobiales bacterium]|nr:ABC transporter permease [Verrucomicrobiales bacterium]
MTRAFQLFRQGSGAYVAIGSGWAWSSLPLPWLWAFLGGLWGRGAILLAVDGLVLALAPSLWVLQPVALGLVLIIPRGICLLRGSHWRAASLENRGLEYVGEIAARSRSDAIAQVARRNGLIPPDLRPGKGGSAFPLPPPGLQPWWAVVRLTVHAAFRYRLVVVLMALLLGAVVVLPMIIKHDGTAQGFTQILLTYTLGVISALLSLVTLWLACGTLARDIDECQMQVVATKPIARWQIWLGKWVGIMVLNAMLLGIAAGAVYLLMQWRATQLPPEVQESLRSNVLTARRAVKEPLPDLDSRVEQLIRQRLPELEAKGVNLAEFRNQAREMIKANEQLVPPEHFKRFRLDMRAAPGNPENRSTFVRVKFHTPELGAKRPYELEIVVGPPETPTRRGTLRSLAAEAAHEIEFGPVPLDNEGFLVVDIANRSDKPLLFPLEDGLEVLYAEGGFGLNYVRALLVTLCGLGLLAAIGLAAASFLSFPVAAFLATTVLILGLSTGTMKSVVEDRTILGLDHETNLPAFPAIDAVMVPVFEAALETVNLVRQFAPIDAVSSGRSVTWGDVARASALVVGLMGGVFAAIGITAFTRRELATAQTHH